MQTKSALVVDDSKVARLTLGKLLRTHGFEITEKGSAEEALQWLQEAATKPDMIFMDVMMGGMDGLSATRKIKEDHDLTAVPVIICTGKETEDDLKQALASGATAVLAKPPAAEAVEKLLADVESTPKADAPQQAPAAPATVPTEALVADLRAQLMPELEQKLNASLSDMQQRLARQQQQEAEPQSGLDKLAELSRQMSESVQQQFGELSQRFSATTEQRVSELAKNAIDSAMTNFGHADKLNQAVREEASGWLSQQQADIGEQLIQELKQTLHADIDSYLNEQLNQRVPELVEQHWQTLQAGQAQQQPELNADTLKSQLSLQRNIAIGAGLLAVVAIILALV